MGVQLNEYYVQLVDTRTKRPINDDTGLYNVMTAGSPAEATIYSDKVGTSGSNPGTMTDGIIQFWTAASVTTVDISILTAGGQSYFIEALTPSQHRVDVNTDRREFTFIVPFSIVTGCNTVIDTGFDLLAGMQVHDVFLHVVTASTADGMYVGVSGTTDGFLALASTTATGLKVYNKPIVTSTTGSTYVSSTQIKGSLISLASPGAATGTVGLSKGFFANFKYAPTAATSLVYTAGLTGNTTGAGYIYVVYELLPTM
jgi:hypothetical protein